MKKFIYSTISAMILLNGVTYVNAQDKKDIIIPNIKNNNEIYENHKDTRYSNSVIKENLSGANGSAVYSFSVSESQPFYRIYIKNDGSSSISVTVGGNSFSVKPGYSYENIFGANSYGRRNIDITSKDGSSLSGKISVRIASSKEELKENSNEY